LKVQKTAVERLLRGGLVDKMLKGKEVMDSRQTRTEPRLGGCPKTILFSERDKAFPKDVGIQSSNRFPNGNGPVVVGIPCITLLKDRGHKTLVKL
jgi:hypothetical protein